MWEWTPNVLAAERQEKASAALTRRQYTLVPGGDGPWWEVPSISPIPGPDRTRSARRGRCRARQLRVHGSGAAHETMRWGCEPHTLGPILQRQGFYTTGCWARTRHSRISMLESSFRCGGSPPALHLEERRVVSNLGAGNSGPSCLGGEGGAVAEVPVYPPIAQLHSSTAPQLL